MGEGVPMNMRGRPETTIVDSIIDEHISRAQMGKEKYNNTMDRTDLSVLDWIQHAQEEHMDAILYLEKLKSVYKEK